MIVTKLDPKDLTIEQITWLLRPIADGREDWVDVSRALARGLATVWEITAPKGRGVMTTLNDGGYLYIWHLGGEGLWRYPHALMKAIQGIARKEDYKGICALTTSTIARFLTRHGFTEEKILIEWRVDNGQGTS